MTDRECDPRMKKCDNHFNEVDDYTRRDYEQHAAWDVGDLEDWARESGDFDVTPQMLARYPQLLRG